MYVTDKTYYLYIMTNAPRGVLYTGMTSDLVGRTQDHREQLFPGFTQRYWLSRLSGTRGTSMLPMPHIASG